IELMTVALGQDAEMYYGATETLREEYKETWTQGFDEIIGGMEQLPRAFVGRLKAKPRGGCEVVAIIQDTVRQKTAAVFLNGDAQDSEEGDAVLCTVPLPALQRIKVDPALSPAKARAVRDMNYDSATRVLAVTETRFWESTDGIYGGGTY